MKYQIRVYKIFWDDKDDIYVGSTKNTLSRRIAQHRATHKSGSKYNLYKAIDNNGLNFNYVILESYDVENNEEMRKHEQYWKDKINANLNTYRCHNTDQDNITMKTNACNNYVKNNKNKIRIRSKKYRNEHIEQERKRYKKYDTENKDKRRSDAKIRYNRDKNIILCHCGGKYNTNVKNKIKRHIKTNRHKDFNILIKNYIL